MFSKQLDKYQEKYLSKILFNIGDYEPKLEILQMSDDEFKKYLDSARNSA